MFSTHRQFHARLSSMVQTCFVHTGKGTADAVNVSLTYMGERVRGGGGAIAVSRTGDWAARFTTERMAWAALEEDRLTYGLNPGEAFKEPVNMPN